MSIPFEPTAIRTLRFYTSFKYYDTDNIILEYYNVANKLCKTDKTLLISQPIKIYILPLPFVTEIYVDNHDTFMNNDISMLASIRTMEFYNIITQPNIRWQLYLPRGITSLTLSSCPHIKSLDELPISLRILYIAGCKKIRSFDNLPMELTRIDCNVMRDRDITIIFDYMPPYLQCITWFKYGMPVVYNDNANYYIAKQIP